MGIKDIGGRIVRAFGCQQLYARGVKTLLKRTAREECN
jgi:hypothetical protein